MIVLTGGGTGGHLSIVKSLKEELNKRGIKPVFIGSINGQDREWFLKDDGFSARYFFDTKGVVNKSKIGKLLSLANIFLYSLKCYFIFKKIGIDKVVSVGGYSAAPASFGAVLFKKELFIHEQNAIIGTLNKKLLPYSKAIFSSYIKESPVKDYPVREDFFKFSREREELRRVIFLGGSQGASFINSLAKELAPALLKEGIEVIHQCGKKEFNDIKSFYLEKGASVELYDFIEDMPKVLHRADLAISRSGASTLWELCANKLPAIFIPYPHAAGNHQYHNAKFLEEKKLAYLLPQKIATKDEIIKIINHIDPLYISSNLSKTIKPNGAKKIIDYILQINSSSSGRKILSIS